MSDTEVTLQTVTRLASRSPHAPRRLPSRLFAAPAESCPDVFGRPARHLSVAAIYV
jgi:hypothetical protein